MNGAKPMTYPLEPYRPPQEVITPIPTTITVAGETYILAPRDGQSQNLPIPVAQQHALQHHVPRAEVAHINGVEHIRTAEGWRPMPSAGAASAWIKHPYTKGYGMFVAAAAMGVSLAVLAIGLYAVIMVAVANALAIGLVIIVIFVGGLVFMGQLTKARHGHAPSRGRH
jgi:hypothetical protein